MNAIIFYEFANYKTQRSNIPIHRKKKRKVSYKN